MPQPVLSAAEVNRKQLPRAQSASLPAPIGGLNARDSWAAMPATDAIILDNWFPTPSNVQVRNGSTSWVNGFSGVVETVMPYNGPGNEKLFAIDSVGRMIQNCTVKNSPPTTPQSGSLSSARLQYLNFSGNGGAYLYYVNGVDVPGYFDGTSFHASSLTGAPGSAFDNIGEFGERLFFTSSLLTQVYFLPVSAIAGALSSLDLGPLMRLGGGIAGMATWDIDNAAGLQQYCVFFTTMGEVFVYQGYDPTEASTFSLAATFRIGRPIGQRFIEKIGSDLILLTVDGAVPLSKSLLTNRSQASIALTDKIRNAVLEDIAQYGDNWGWQIKFHPAGQKLIINVPAVSDQSSYQYVMNTITGAWCTFGKYHSSWEAICFDVWEDELYFGANMAVGVGDSGTSDLGANITADVLQAFNYFGAPGVNKNFTMARPNILTDGSIKFICDINTDFHESIPVGTASYSSSGTPWGSPWGSPWSPVTTLQNDWLGTTAIGYCGALRLIASLQDVALQWQSTDFVYQSGGVL